MHSPLFSIIIPTFNAAKTLQRALNSIFEQNYKNFEIIIVDGCSSDNTITLINENCSKDPRIRHLSEIDNGIYDAMNKGIDMATGQWLYFLGSDDIFYDENVLLKVADKLKDCQCDFFYGQVIMKSAPYDGPFTLTKLLKKNISHQAIFYMKLVFDKLGTYNIRYKLHADWEFNIRYFLLGDSTAKYADILIANFSEGGVSSVHDVLFLQEYLLPLKLQKLAANTTSLKTIKEYDEWWRLIRNAEIRSLKQLMLLCPDCNIPIVLIKAVEMQQHFSSRSLRFGLISKLIMTMSFIINQITKQRECD